MLCLKFIVSGRVQGIGFRYSTKMRADGLGITGYAKNLVGGTVEILVCGNKQNLEAFKNWLYEGGDTFAKINKIQEKEISVENSPPDFTTL